MAQYEIIPGRGKVKVSNSFCGGVITPSRNTRLESPYERTKRQVYATGNKWAIENFHATHD